MTYLFLSMGWFSRSGRSQMFFKIDVLRKLPNLAEKHLCWTLFLIKFFFIKKRLQHRCFPVKFVKLLRTFIFTEYLRWLLSDSPIPRRAWDVTQNLYFSIHQPLHCVKKCPYSELFWSAFSWIWTRITRNTDIFHAVLRRASLDYYW